MKKKIFACILCIAMLAAYVNPVFAANIKNVIYMVPAGGGMELFYLAGKLKSAGGWDKNVYPNATETEKGDMFIRKYMAAGLNTDNKSGGVTDSRAAGTALATGYKTNNGYLGVDSDKIPKASLLEIAQFLGKRTGVITNGNWSNDTVAAFSAHEAGTSDGAAAEQIINQEIDVVMGGEIGASAWGNIIEAENRGYKVIDEANELENILPGDKIWGSFTSSYDIERDTKTPGLAQMTSAAINALSAGDDGFFLVVENEKLNDACKAHSVKNAVGEYMAFDEACRAAISFAEKRNDTVVIIAQNHDTGAVVLPSDTSNAIGDLKKGNEPKDIAWSSSGISSGGCGLFIYAPSGTAYPDGMQTDSIGTKRTLTKNVMNNSDVAGYVAKLMGANQDAVSEQLFSDVTEKGEYNSENGMFKFNDGHGYSVRIKPNTSYAFFDDKAISLNGEVALYINSRFYVPKRLLGIMDGTMQGESYEKVASPISSELKTYINDGNISDIRAKITISKLIPEKAISGKIKFTYPDAMAKTAQTSFSINAGEMNGAVEVKCEGISPASESLIKYEIVTDDGKVYPFEGKSERFVYAGYAANSITVDGKLDETVWNDAAKISLNSAEQASSIKSWGGADDLSGTAMVMWDEEYFYFGAEVKDDVFSQTNEDPANLWNGDSIQFGVFMGTEKISAGNAGSNFEEIGLALLPTGSEAYRFLSQGKTNNGRIKKGDSFSFECVQNGNETVYEMKISWRALVGAGYLPKSGDSIGFSMLLNENDGDGRRGYMEYGSGIGGLKNGSKFKILSLLGANKTENAEDTDEIKVICDGEKLVFDVNPIIEEGRVLVPVRAIFEKLGAEVNWNTETRTVYSKTDDREVTLTIDEAKVIVNDEDRPVDVPARIIDGRTLVPVRAVSEAYECNVLWKPETRTVIITK